MTKPLYPSDVRALLNLDAQKNLSEAHLARMAKEHALTSHLAPHFLLEVVPNEAVHGFLTRLFILHGADFTTISGPDGERNKTVVGVLNLVVNERMLVEDAIGYIRSVLPKPVARNYTDLGKEISRLRAVAKVTQHDLASRLNVMPSNVSRWENGVTRPTDLNLVSLATILNGDFTLLHSLANPSSRPTQPLTLPQATASVRTVPVTIGEPRALTREEREDEAYDNYLHRNEPGSDWGPIRRRRQG